MVTIVTAAGRPASPGGPRPSAETAIHAAIYQAWPDCGAVVHAHPPYATALTMMCGGEARFDNYEIAKGLGVPAPWSVHVPVFENHPEVSEIAADIARYYARAEHAPPALLIARHGVTAWGPDLQTARNRLECLESLCQLALLTGAYPEKERTP
jgi:ribulose-5-phosphate 4-epimerase/fuculose-1-phosphate aldolase